MAEKNELVESSPDDFTIFDDRLYLNYNKNVAKKFNSNIKTMIKKADQNWHTMSEKKVLLRVRKP